MIDSDHRLDADQPRRVIEEMGQRESEEDETRSEPQTLRRGTAPQSAHDGGMGSGRAVMACDLAGLRMILPENFSGYSRSCAAILNRKRRREACRIGNFRVRPSRGNDRASSRRLGSEATA